MSIYTGACEPDEPVAPEDDPAKGLEVVAHMRRWAFDKEPEFKVRDPNTNRMRLHRKFTLYATTVPKMLKDDVPLTDHATATRQIAELRGDLESMMAQRDVARDLRELAEADAARVRELLKPFATLADKFTGPMVEVCDPHPDNPSRTIQPLAAIHLEAAFQALTQRGA